MHHRTGLLAVRVPCPCLHPVEITVGICGLDVMTSAAALYATVLDHERRFPLLSVRLIEPSETIIANNPELKVEQTVDGEMVFMSPTEISSYFKKSLKSSAGSGSCQRLCGASRGIRREVRSRRRCHRPRGIEPSRA